MKLYIYNTNYNRDGFHEVHAKNDCTRLPEAQNTETIGYASDCYAAMTNAKAMTGKDNFDGCYYCSPECNAEVKKT